MAGRIRVLIVDDSAVVRQVLTAVLEQDPGIEVIGAVADPIFAMERMNRDWPDALILDVEMPRMDGLTFLRKLMAVRPTPVVICWTPTERAAEVTLEAIAAGAVGFVTKPTSGLRTFLAQDAGELVRAVKSAATGTGRPARSAPAQTPAPTPRPAPPAPRAAARPAAPPPVRTGTARPAGNARPASTARPAGSLVVAIGTSTGGTQALELVLTRLPRASPGIVVVQHMPEAFTAAFAGRLNGLCELEVLEAADGDRVLPGRVLIAPGGRHLALERDGAHYRARITDGPRINRHKPSVDVLFESVARVAGRNALGVIMTGMGDDGARGLLQMRHAGARTLGQDQASCVVYGMPQAAWNLGAVERELPLAAIPAAIESFSERPTGARRN